MQGREKQKQEEFMELKGIGQFRGARRGAEKGRRG